MKKISIFASVLAALVVLGGCARDTKPAAADVAACPAEDGAPSMVAARMSTEDSRDRIGSVRFKEHGNALSMAVRMRDLKPNTEYKLCVHDMSNCDVNAKRVADETCEKERMGLGLPRVTSDANGDINQVFTVTNTTTSQLVGNKMSLTRMDEDCMKEKAAWGMIHDRR